MALRKPGDAARADLERRQLKPTERLQSAYDTPMKEYRVRMPAPWWKSLQEDAAARGMKASALVRELILQYLQQSGR